MKAAILYMLITVTSQGDVHYSNGYPASHGYAEATQAIMAKLAISHEELSSWRVSIAQQAGSAI